MNNRLPRMCVVSATPLTIHFFLKPHLRELSQYFEVSLACNLGSDTYLPPLDLPVRQLAVPIERKVSIWSDMVALFALCRVFRRERFDIVVSVVPKAGLLGMLAAWLLRVPIRVHIFQGEVWASKGGLMRFFLKFLDTVTAHLATHVLAVSTGEKSFLEQERVTPVGKVQVLGEGSICGVDTEKFRPDPVLRNQVRAELAIPEDAMVCIFLGRLARDKGVLDLARAFSLSAASRPDLWLLFVGPDEDQLEVLLRKLVPEQINVRMHFAGFTQYPERYLAASDLLCLPSYREGFGVAILEAAAVGVPAIGTRIYGVSDAIQDGRTGMLVPVRDIEELSKTITRWCTLPEERSQFASAAQDRVNHEFEQKQVVDRYVLYFRDLFSNKSS